MPGPMTAPGSHFVGYTGTAFSHALLLLWRRKHLLVLLVITLLPGLLPLLLWFFSGKASHSGPKSFFNDMAFHVYLENLVPLVSVFFGCSLVSEELDNRTIHHILTRPIPRSAWLLGRFMAFTTASFLSFAAGLGFLFGACALTGNIQAVSSNLMILIHYIGITAFALLPYTALCTFWGASMKKPMVLSLVVIIGWQNLALLMPGVVDFLTIEKIHIGGTAPGRDCRQYTAVSCPDDPRSPEAGIPGRNRLVDRCFAVYYRPFHAACNLDGSPP